MKEVQNLLANTGISYKITYLGQGIEDEWQHDLWSVRIFNARKSITTKFKTGLGLRSYNRPKAPEIAAILYSLLLDAEYSNDTFDDWCDACGYSKDSIKALMTYLECKRIGTKLRSIFTHEQIAKIEDLLEDY